MSAYLRKILLIVSGSALLFSSLVYATSGFSAALFGLRIRSHQPLVILASSALLLAVALLGWGRQAVGADLAAAWNQRAAASRWIAGLSSLAVLVVGLSSNTWSAGGADAYGYISQAQLFASGEIRVDQPVARGVPWPQPDWTFSPLGYRPGPTPGDLVPTYPPGLPLFLAPFVWMFGIESAYVAVCLLGSLAVWLTFWIGRRIAGPIAGSIASILIACSPTFLYQLIQPMSDVPVTAWWLAALAFAFAKHPGWSGFAASLAVLTRPNLFPLALLLAAWNAVEHYYYGRTRRAPVVGLAWFCGMAAPLGALLLWLNHTWYGSVFASGYGSASDLFTTANIWPNLDRYVRWLGETHTPVLALAVLAPLMAWWHNHATRDLIGPAGARIGDTAWREVHTPRASACLVGALVVLACYLPYARFEEWWYLRFLLPGLALLIPLFALVIYVIVERAPAWFRAPAALVLTCLLASVWVHAAYDRQVFELHTLESRYAESGAVASSLLPAEAVLLTVQQSGSLRLYSNRLTLRWDLIDPAWLEHALDDLRVRGYVPYFVLEAWEEDQFKARFSRLTDVGRLDWPPLVDVGRPVHVRFYDPAARDAYVRGRLATPMQPRLPTF